jgi:hypothetical protein
MKLACVIHRFGADIAGGSESHCRVVAEHLAADHDVTIITTCAKDHVTWKNHYPGGESQIGRLRVLRFPVARPRDLHRFMDISDLVFADRASPAEQELGRETALTRRSCSITCAGTAPTTIGCCSGRTGTTIRTSECRSSRRAPSSSPPPKKIR